jgi:hypothetical protein
MTLRLALAFVLLSSQAMAQTSNNPIPCNQLLSEAACNGDDSVFADTNKWMMPSTPVIPKPLLPDEPVNDDFKRGACWAVHAAFPESQTATVMFGGANFTCQPIAK